MCGDDWRWASVRKGLNRAIKVLKVNVMHKGNFWWLEK